MRTTGLFVCGLAGLIGTSGPASASEPEWRLLRQTEVEASSFLRSNWNKYSENYHPNYVADDDPKTAWVEGVDGNGEGETLRLPTSVLKEARAVRLRIRNGYQKSEGLLSANAAPRGVRVAVLGGAGEVAHADVTLTRTMGWQEVVVPLPPGKGVSAVELRVDSVHPGSKYKDTCISDVQVFADTDVVYRSAIEEARFQRLQAWTAERKKTAAYFASLPATYPFAATAFREVAGDDADHVAVTRQLLAVKKEAEAAREAGGWMKVTRKRGELEAPDQLWLLGDFLDVFQTGQLGFFESDDQFAKRKREEFVYGWNERHRTNAKVTFTDDSRAVPATLWFEVHSAGEERGPWHNTRQVFTRCNEQGQPTMIFVRAISDDELGRREVLSRFSVRWTAEGQVDRIERVTRTFIEGLDPSVLEQYGSKLFERALYTPASGV